MAARVFVVSPPWVKVKSNGVSLGHAIASRRAPTRQVLFPDYWGNQSAPVAR
jgi:hypothetical protein